MHTNNETFLQAIEENLDGVEFFSQGYCGICETCRLHVDASRPVVEFANTRCRSCGTQVAGTRHYAHGFIDGELEHMEICFDCAIYHTSGELPYYDAEPKHIDNELEHMDGYG